MIKPGDIFVTASDTFFGAGIRLVTKFWSIDDDAEYNHGGIITSEAGDTVESLWKIGRYSLAQHDGNKILVGRHKLMTEERFNRGMGAIEGYIGRVYPWWRIPLHIIPPMAKYFSTGDFLVCSELTCKFLWGAGLLETYKGWTPDHVADMIVRWKFWEIVHWSE